MKMMLLMILNKWTNLRRILVAVRDQFFYLNYKTSQTISVLEQPEPLNPFMEIVCLSKQKKACLMLFQLVLACLFTKIHLKKIITVCLTRIYYTEWTSLGIKGESF